MRNLPKRIAYVACAWLVLFAAFAAQSAESTQDPVEAVWRTQRLTFLYRSEGTIYSCNALEQKIKIILSKLGARDRLQLRRIHCRDFDGWAQLEVFMESPVVPTADNIRAITHHDSKDELVARVRGVPLPAPEDLERFPAVWETIQFRGPGNLYAQERDCALVQQLRRQILPNMSVQVTKDIDRLDCSRSKPRLTVVALVAAAEITPRSPRRGTRGPLE